MKKINKSGKKIIDKKTSKNLLEHLNISIIVLYISLVLFTLTIIFNKLLISSFFYCIFLISAYFLIRQSKEISLSKNTKKWQSITISIILLIIIFALFLISTDIINLFINNFFKKLEIYIFIYFLGSLLFYLFSFELIFRLIINLFAKEYPKDRYLTFALSVILIILIIGFSQIKIIYGEDLPLNISSNENGPANLYCKSTSGENYFKEYDKLYCEFNSKLNENYTYINDSIGFYLNFGDRKNFNEYGYFYEKGNEINYQITNLTLKRDINRIAIYFSYKNEVNGKILQKFFNIYPNPLTLEEIENKQINRVNILILFLSASIFSILAGMKTLRDLVKGK